ncbi:MAG TPA: ABC transporter permease [Chloroflexota bacterium]|nr:ABC transporter permease [Chloroflexota bacterium]
MGKTASGKRNGALTRSLTREFGALTGLVLICIALSIAKPDSFPRADNLINVLMQVSPVAIVAAGMTFIIISGGIDLSVGSVLSFSACVGGYMAASMGLNVWVALAGALAVGLIFGGLNGLLITAVGLPPFIATLGTMGIARGLAYRMTGGATIYDVRPEFIFLGSGKVLGLPAATVALVIIYIVGHLVLSRAKVGRYTYSIGGNEDASLLSGVPVWKTKLFAYALTGLLAAVAGIITAGRVGAVAPQAGDGFELDVIAAVVIGGTSLAGGQGRLVGSIIGALIMGVVRNGLNLMLIDSNWQRVVIGSIIVIAAAIDVLQKKRGAKAFSFKR